MRLGEFKLVDFEQGEDPHAVHARFNDTRTDYPRDRTIHALFAEQAARTPEAPAVFHGARTYSYATVEAASTRLARCLIKHDLAPEAPVAVMLDRTFELVVTLLGILKAGGSYAPLEPDAPLERARLLIGDTGARMLICERRFIRTANRLQWECPDLRLLLCADSDDVHGEIEGGGGMMREAIWDEVGRTASDDIAGGGWTSSYTGALLSRAVMDEYGDSAARKLEPFLTGRCRVLEVACGSGITMFRVAPRVAYYHATDLSAEILRWTRAETTRRGLDTITLEHLPAHAIDDVSARDFDVVILNSVVQCFSGHNYLRDVLHKCIGLMRDQGIIFLGNLWDQDRKEEFVASLRAFRDEHRGRGYHTKVDRSEELFISRDFLEDLRGDLPAIQAIDTSLMLGQTRSELSEYGYDAILTIDKHAEGRGESPRNRLQLDRRAVVACDEAPLAERTGPHQLAYIMYTSGTAGRPKGVMVEHRAVVRLVKNTNYVSFGSEDRCLQTGSLAFDASTFEIWGPMLNGGAVCRPPARSVLNPAEVARLIRTHRISTMWLTASLFNHHVESDLGMFEGLKVLIVGGERLSPEHVGRVRERYPLLRLLNGYGPTENTTFTTCHPITGLPDGDVPIGAPIANTAVLILDRQRHEPLGVGVTGEICVAGDGLARGYLGDAALTAARFAPHPFGQGERVYHTGDLGRWRADGVVEYLGRVDDQVKIRGHRVEPREIEGRIGAHPGVTRVLVLGRNDGAVGRYLVAYLTGPDPIEIARLRADLQAALPDYLVPAYFVQLDEFPLGPNGKVDRAVLPDPGRAAGVSGLGRVEPASETERTLVRVWEEVLGQTGIGVTDNFFEAGGHSLTVARVVALIEKRLGAVVPLKMLFELPTIRALASHLLDETRFGTALGDDALARLSGSADDPAVFAFPPGTGDAAGYILLSRLLAPYAVQAFNFIERDTRLADYADLVAGVQPSGPYLFLGYSSGGNLAYHVARELERRGMAVSAILMLDSARQYRPVPFDPDEVQRISDEFLAHESNKPYLTSVVLREKAERRITRSYQWIRNTVDEHDVAADIHLLVSEETVEAYHDESGRLVASASGWSDRTRGRFQTYQAEGPHAQMLHYPYLDRNAELIREVLERCGADTRVPRAPSGAGG